MMQQQLLYRPRQLKEEALPAQNSRDLGAMQAIVEVAHASYGPFQAADTQESYGSQFASTTVRNGDGTVAELGCKHQRSWLQEATPQRGLENEVQASLEQPWLD